MNRFLSPEQLRLQHLIWTNNKSGTICGSNHQTSVYLHVYMYKYCYTIYIIVKGTYTNSRENSPEHFGYSFCTT